MNIRTLLLPLLFIYSMASGQVGINTQTPEATLDISAANSLGSVTSGDGLLVPRINSLATNGSINGQLVYLVENAGAFNKGFYYWNGASWIAMGGSSDITDTTDDAWKNSPSNAKIHLASLSDGTTAPRPAGTEFVISDSGLVGIGTENPKAALDLNSTAAGFIPPKVSTAQREALTSDNRPTGALIYNTTINKVQLNMGTAAFPIWVSLGVADASTTNTVAVWKKTASQAVGASEVLLNFDTTSVYDGTPAGYVVQTAADTWNLAKGKTYEIIYDQGYVVGNSANTANCGIRVNGVIIESSRSRATTSNGNNNWSGPSAGFAIVEATVTTTINLACHAGGGTKTYASSTSSFPRIQFKILN